jgi:hypothetical protein
MHINISPRRNLLVINWLPYKGVRAPHAEGRQAALGRYSCARCFMQEKEKEGCWFMTIGHVYYQEPVRVMSQIYYSSVLLMRLLGVGGGGGRGWGSSNSDDLRKSLALCLLCGLIYFWFSNRFLHFVIDVDIRH